MRRTLQGERGIMRGVESTQRRAGVFFLLPLVLLMAVFVFVPEIGTIVLSVSTWKGVGALKGNGIKNFVQLTHDKIFIQAVVNTVRVGAVSAVLALVIGLALALSLQSVGATESVLYRTMLFIPVILPLTIVGLLFAFVFNLETGILNQLLRILGLGSVARAWLSEPKVAIWSITFVEIWKNAGLPMLMIYASLITIPSSVYEAAHIDGATRLQMIMRISLPLTKPVIKMSLIYLFILGFRTYDLIYIMTKGGPGRLTTTVPIWMVETAYNFNNFGYAASMGVSLALVILVIVGISAFVLRGESHEMS
jgi:raffinose/stachyose/melibiose transport system permease protein